MTPPPLPTGYRIARVVLTCDPDTAGGWKGPVEPVPELEVEFVDNGCGWFARIRRANWFSVDSMAKLGAWLDSVCRHNEANEGK